MQPDATTADPPPVIVTTHALRRFRERFDKHGAAAQVAALAAGAEVAPAWVRKALAVANRDHATLLVAGECVLAVVGWGTAAPVVVTVMPLHYARSNAKRPKPRIKPRTRRR